MADIFGFVLKWTFEAFLARILCCMRLLAAAMLAILSDASSCSMLETSHVERTLGFWALGVLVFYLL